MSPAGDIPEGTSHGSGHSKKRKRHDGEQDRSDLPDSISISSPFSASPFSEPIRTSLTPIRLLDRACLPLQYLDLQGAGRQYFRGVINCLEPAESDARWASKLLLASESRDAAASLCVVERVSDNVYCQCSLRSGVELQNLLKPPRYSHAPLETVCVAPHTPTEWWRSADIQAVGKHASPSQGIARIKLCLGAIKQPPRPMPMDAPIGNRPDPTTAIISPMTLELDNNIDQNELPTNREVSDNETFLAHYLDTLYLSRTSLAYFAKSSLPRLRVSLGAGTAEFLRGMIIASKTSDGKYKDVLPKAAQDASMSRASDIDTPKAIKKARKTRKLKVDKQGLLGGELDYFAQWWHSDESTNSFAGVDETVAQQMKRRSLGLRTRETFMQVMLILEVMICEADVGAVQSLDHEEAESELKGKDKGKSKKRQDLSLLLELLLDKLAIWHSLDHPTPHAGVRTGRTPADQVSNVLRDFCVDVIIPFYSSRLPDASKIVNRKLGGPLPSPKRSRPAKPTTRTSEQAHVPERRRRAPLERMSSEQIRQPSAALPGLHRSATDSQLVRRDRGSSETLSYSNKVQTTARVLERKPSAMDKIRLRQREVDFDAMSQAQEAKKKKQAEIDARVKDAISALKKPQRTLVSAEVADAVAQRTLIARARARPSLARKRTKSATQVEATPRHTRSEIVEMTPQHHVHSAAGAASSSAVAIPSTVRPSIGSDERLTNGDAKRARQGYGQGNVEESPSRGTQLFDPGVYDVMYMNTVVEATPSRGAGRFKKPALPTSTKAGVIRSLRFEAPVTHSVPGTPTKRDRSYRNQDHDYAQAFPAHDTRREATNDDDDDDDAMIAASPQSKTTEMVGATPLMKKPVLMHGESTGAREDVDIYDALGWND